MTVLRREQIMYLHGTSTINNKNHLEIGGVDTVHITREFGTPVYVYDVALIRERAIGFKKAFEEAGINYQVAYASKAFSCIAMFQLADELGLSLDVVSSGELMTAKKQISRWIVFIFMATIKVRKKLTLL